jgi:hypothetical protein
MPKGAPGLALLRERPLAVPHPSCRLDSTVV